MDTVGGRGPIVACNEGVIQKKGRAPLNLAPIKVLLRVNTIERYESVRGSRTNGGREGERKEGTISPTPAVPFSREEGSLWAQLHKG